MGFNIFCIGFALSLLDALAAYVAISWAAADKAGGAAVPIASMLVITYRFGCFPRVYKLGLPKHG